MWSRRCALAAVGGTLERAPGSSRAAAAAPTAGVAAARGGPTARPAAQRALAASAGHSPGDSTPRGGTVTLYSTNL